ncbi:MAG: sortase [Chloroflexi bacterium]|nr:sortase [Chloroflexota bacterium]
MQLVYERDGEWLLADTIQPNPQITGGGGEYRFDLNITRSSGDGIPQSGQRRFRLEVLSVPAEHVFPSERIVPDDTFVGGAQNGQITPFSAIPDPDGAGEYHLEFILNRGDADPVNNHLPVDLMIPIVTSYTNEACVTEDDGAGGRTSPVCAQGAVSVDSEVDFTLTPATDSDTINPGESTSYTHTLENTGTQSDSYTISFPAGTQGWPQTLEIQDPGGTTTLNAGDPPFVTSSLAPGETITLVHTIDVPAGVVITDSLNPQVIDTTTITISSVEADQAGETLENTATDTTTVDAACVVGTVYFDDNANGLRDPGEAGIPNVRLFVYQGSPPNLVLLPDVSATTDSLGDYLLGLAAGTYTLEIDPTTLPEGTPVYISPTSPRQTVTPTIGGNCLDASYGIQIANPAISKTTSVTQAAIGDTVIFTVTVQNGSTTLQLTNAAVEDSLSGFLEIPAEDPSAITPSQGTCSYAAPLINCQLGTIAPGAQATVTIRARIRDTAPVGGVITNRATLIYSGTRQDSQEVQVTVLGDAGDTEDETDGTDGDGTDGEGTGEDEDFGTGGPVVGQGEEGEPDTLPTTGYRPLDWGSSDAPPNESGNLSTGGRIAGIVLGLLLIAIAGGLWYAYNNSARLYSWLENKPAWIGTALLGLIVILFIVGGSGVIYTANDATGLVDLNGLVGLGDEDDSDDQLAGDTADDGSAWTGEDGTPPPTVALPRPDTDTRRVIIPALNIYTQLVNAPIMGTTWDVSNFFDEIAHLEGTAPPGTTGNTVLAGHVSHNRGVGPFRGLHNINIGDYVIVKDYDVEYSYIVTEVEKVAPHEIDAIAPSRESMVTLVTCSDWDQRTRTYKSRIIVRATLDRWRIISNETAEAYEAELGELTRYEVGDTNRIKLRGEWEEIHSYNVSETSYFYSGDRDAEAEFTFVGDKFRLHYVLYENFGMFDVYLDGKRILTIDGYSPYSGFGSTEVFQVPYGNHRIRIVNTGEANESSSGHVIGLDAIDVWR